MPLAGVGGGPKAVDVLREIHVTEALAENGLMSTADARTEVGRLIGDLIASDDVQPSHAQDASAVLDRLCPETPRPGASPGLLGKLKQVFSDLRGKSETFAKSAPPTSKAAISAMKEAAQMATIPYVGLLTPAQNNGMTQYVAMGLDYRLRNDEGRGQVRSSVDPQGNGSFVDRKSGLVANVVVNPDTKQIHVIFGGTTAGAFKSEDFKLRSKHNFATTLSQWVTNLKTGLGIKPHSLHQAANMVSQVVDMVKTDPRLRDYTVDTIGHSKGASEAVYAALVQDTPLHATGFSSADLGGSLVRGLPAQNVAKAKELVQHFHVKADLVPNLRFVTPSMRPLGTEVVIPAIGMAGPLGRHDEFADHITAWADNELAKFELGSRYSATPG
jgi:hypothetical protein